MDENQSPKLNRPKSAAPNSGKIESPEVLAKRTLDALSKNDYPALTQLGLETLPKEALIEIMVSIRYPLTDEYIRETAQRRGITKEQAEEDIKDKILKGRTRMAERYQEGIKQISAKRKASFEKVISVGKKQAKIEWSKVSFVRLEGKAYERGGIKGGDYFIIFEYNGSQFKIKLDDCTYHPRHGWFIQHGPDWDETTGDGHATAEEGSSHEEPAPPKPAPNAPSQKLTPEEVVKVLDMWVGEWTAVDRETNELVEKFTIRLKKQGESIEGEGTLFENRTAGGGKLTFEMTYNPELNVFVQIIKPTNMPPLTRHFRWNFKKDTGIAEYVTPTPPEGIVPIATWKKTGPDTTQRGGIDKAGHPRIKTPVKKGHEQHDEHRVDGLNLRGQPFDAEKSAIHLLRLNHPG